MLAVRHLPRVSVWIAAALLPLVVLAGCSTARAELPVPRAEHADRGLGPGVVPERLLVEPDDGVRPLIRAIDRAQTQIFVEVYILSDRNVERALERASAQGVSVDVLLEPHPFGLGSEPQHTADLLRAAGIAVRWTRPGFVYTHAKIMVLDDRTAVISSANFSRSAFTRNRDVLVFDRSVRDVRQLSELFRADWDRTPPSVLTPDLIVAPDNARLKLTRLLDSARHSIAMDAEELTDTSVERDLVAAVRRGVRVRILLPGGSTLVGRQYLAHGGVNVHALRPLYVHAKVLIIDRHLAYAGSENFSSTSLDRNREVGVLLRGWPVRRLSSVFDRDWSRSTALP